MSKGRLGLIDLHCHIIPCVDDGPSDIEDALEMCRISYRDGVRKIVATPHFFDEGYDGGRVTFRRVFDWVEKLNARFRALGFNPSLEILPGAEVRITEDLPKAVEEKRVLTVADRGRYIMVELPPFGVPSGTESILFQLLSIGVVPVIVHPEKVLDFWDNPNRYFEMVRMGCLGQLTASSLRVRGRQRKISESFLSHRLVHFLASDGHSSVGRHTPVLSDCLLQVEKIVGRVEAWKMVTEYPSAVLEGRGLSFEDPIPF